MIPDRAGCAAGLWGVATRAQALRRVDERAARSVSASTNPSHANRRRLPMPKRKQETLFKQRAADDVAQAIAVTPSLERQQWLERAVEALRTRFTDAGYTIPQRSAYRLAGLNRWQLVVRSASAGRLRRRAIGMLNCSSRQN